MNTNINRCLLAMAIAMALLKTSAQEPNFTSRFPLDDCHFSTFGGRPYFILNPGHQLTLKGREEGKQVVLTITPLNETKTITLRRGGRTRRILTRVVEERESAGGKLIEVSRNWFARCIETGDIYYFGEEVDFYENGRVVSHEGSWEAGVNGALPGVVMPGTFLLGSRYLQELAPGIAMDQAENSAVGLTVQTPAGQFTQCVRVKEFNPLEPDAAPEFKTYAPGVGLISDNNVLKLDQWHLGKIEGLPEGCTLVPFSNHPFFPLSPGRQLVLEGRKDGESVSLTITVLEAIEEISLPVRGREQMIRTRVVEERETVDGALSEVSRNFFAQCLETGDVYYFGEEVDFYKNGLVIGHEGAWRAGVGGAQPGIIMPGHFATGAKYFQERAEGVALDFAENSASDVTITVPSGTFTGCVTVTETNLLKPGEEPETKTYAPGIGLINDANVLKLKSYVIPGSATNRAELLIQEAVLLTWPLTDLPLQIESSSDLESWSPVPETPIAADGRNTISVPKEAHRKFFRLSPE